MLMQGMWGFKRQITRSREKILQTEQCHSDNPGDYLFVLSKTFNFTIKSMNIKRQTPGALHNLGP